MPSNYHNNQDGGVTWHWLPAGVSRGDQRQQAFFALFALLVLYCGPATGLLHAIHLSQAGDSYDHKHCAYCQHLIAIPKDLPDQPVELPSMLLPVWDSVLPTTADLTSQHIPHSVLPRGPPTLAVL